MKSIHMQINGIYNMLYMPFLLTSSTNVRDFCGKQELLDGDSQVADTPKMPRR